MFQTNWNAYVAYKAQTGRGVAASGAGAKILPLTGGKGQLTKKPITSDQIRQDGMSVRGRHGSQATTGNYPGELQVSNYDDILEAVMRGTWVVPAALTQSTAALASATISVSGHVVTFSTGSLITAGVRVGDVHRWIVGLAPADIGRALRVTGVTALAITYADELATVAGPVETYSFGIPGKKLINPPAGALVKRYFTIEEYEADADESELFTDCVWGKIDISMQPNGMVKITPTWTGTGAAEALQDGEAPYYTVPDVSDQIPLAAIDASLRFANGDLLDLTAFSLTIDIGLTATEVAGANISPDVFDSPMKVSGSLTVLRQDLSQFAAFLGEETQTLQLLAAVPHTSPTEYISITVPYFTLGSVDKSELSKQGGPRTQTLAISEELVGRDPRGGAYDPTMVSIVVSNAD